MVRAHHRSIPGAAPWRRTAREIRRPTTCSRRRTPRWSSSTTSRARCRPSRRSTTSCSSTTSCRWPGSRKTFDLPVVLSTVNVANGQGPTIPELKAVLSDSRGDRPDADQLLGGRRVPSRRRGDRAQEADHDRAVDRGVPGLSVARRAPRGLRGLSRRRRRRRARRPKRTGPGSSASSRRARSPSAGSRWRASCSGTGRAWRPLPTSSTSC